MNDLWSILELLGIFLLLLFLFAAFLFLRTWISRSRRINLTVLVVTVVSIGVFVLFSAIPVPIADDPSQVKIYRVTVSDEEEALVYHDITEQTDLDALARLVAEQTRDRLPHRSYGYSTDSVKYELSGLCADERFHIVVGPGKNYIYESAEKGVYDLKDPQEFLEAMDTLTGR